MDPKEPFPVCYPTVDIAIWHRHRLLLGHKRHEDAWRFIGGFAEPSSESYEADAIREVFEEANIRLHRGDLKYVGSFLVDDVRYTGPDRIKTILFEARLPEYAEPKPVAGDDIHEVEWFPYYDLEPKTVVKSHQPLLAYLLSKKGLTTT